MFLKKCLSIFKTPKKYLIRSLNKRIHIQINHLKRQNKVIEKSLNFRKSDAKQIIKNYRTIFALKILSNLSFEDLCVNLSLFEFLLKSNFEYKCFVREYADEKTGKENSKIQAYLNEPKKSMVDDVYSRIKLSNNDIDLIELSSRLNRL